jgi:drug/metabolite transporter (DMT)-like permease
MLMVLGAAALHATWNALIKAGSDKFLDMALIVTGAGVCAGLVLPFRALPAPASWPYLCTSVAIHFAYFTCVALAYRQGDLSYAYPMMRGTAPLLTAAVAALVVHEPLSPGGMLGIALLSLGILLLAGDSFWSGTRLLAPTLFALANAVVISAYTIVDGLGVRRSGDAASYVSWLLFLSALGLLSCMIVMRRPAFVLHLQAYWKQGLLGGLCTVVSYGLALWAMTHASVALVAALRETSVIFAAVIGAVSLKERFGMARYVAASMVTAGAAAMRIL